MQQIRHLRRHVESLGLCLVSSQVLRIFYHNCTLWHVIKPLPAQHNTALLTLAASGPMACCRVLAWLLFPAMHMHEQITRSMLIVSQDSNASKLMSSWPALALLLTDCWLLRT